MTREQDRERSLRLWPTQKIAELTRLYVDEGITTEQIGLRMGITKNAVIGKVNRLGLVRGAGFVPTAQQAGRIKQEELRGPVSTLNTRLDALNVEMDAVLARPRPAPIVPRAATDNATRPMQRAAQR